MRHGEAQAEATRGRKRGEEKTSRLAGAGGAAERALMNAQAHSGQPEVGGVKGSDLRVHGTKFTSISARVPNDIAFL